MALDELGRHDLKERLHRRLFKILVNATRENVTILRKGEKKDDRLQTRYVTFSVPESPTNTNVALFHVEEFTLHLVAKFK